MTLNLQELAVINEAQAKLIHQLMIEKMELEHKLEQREYNRRFTNTKHLKTVIDGHPLTQKKDPLKIKVTQK